MVGVDTNDFMIGASMDDGASSLRKVNSENVLRNDRMEFWGI